MATSNLKEIVQQGSEPLCFELGNDDGGQAYVKVYVSPESEVEFKQSEKANMEFFRQLGEILAEADRAEQNEKYKHTEIQGSLFDSIQQRRGGRGGQE